MGRKSKECHEEGGAWEIALADLMTVLMVFFLVMWLTSIVEPSKRDDLVGALMGERTEEDVAQLQEGEAMLEVDVFAERPPITVNKLREALAEDGIVRDIVIEDTEDYIKITLRSDSFFESARASINDNIRTKLEKLGESLSGRDQNISITGHTDNIPISNFQFPSNWELSASRAATVARTFVGMGVDPELITIKGRSDNDPVVQNITSYARSLNRRVVILVDKNSRHQVP